MMASDPPRWGMRIKKTFLVAFLILALTDMVLGWPAPKPRISGRFRASKARFRPMGGGTKHHALTLI
jgi:hypothetical protein